MLSQPAPIVPPLPTDSRLVGFAQIVQSSFGTLFQAGHVHRVISAEPRANSGEVGDIYLFDDNTTIYLYIKTSRGWAKSPAFTLV